MAGNRTFRVFVSSTFADLKAERNALQEHVFPKLQKLCEANGCRFQAVDLRWGVSEEAALDQQTMNICLTELKRCQDVSPRPNFIILLGDRYGWMPLPPQIEASEFDVILSQVTNPVDKALLADWYKLDTNAVPPEYVLRPRQQEVPEESDYDSWGETEKMLRGVLLEAVNRLGWPADDARRIKYECSATHQEIIEGALKLPDEREHVFAFLRSIQNLGDLPPGSDYTDGGMEKVRALKGKIRQTRGVTSFDYDLTWSGAELASHIERFTADALASLTRIVEEEFRQLEQIDDLTREDIAHQEFGAERCRHFVGRQKILDDIAAYLKGSQSSPLVIYGPSGSGKSALMAKAAANAAGENKQAYIIQRFIGATPESTDIRALLENLCREITGAYQGDAATIPTECKDLKEELPKRLALATRDKPLILFLDALDQLSASDNAHALNWLPSELPANVKIVVSVLEREDDTGQCFKSARSKVPESELLRLDDMTPEEGSEALGAWLRDANRVLTEEQMGGVLAGFIKCPMPLYLKLAFEEARLWKSYDWLPCGADDVPGLAGDVPGVVGDMLARLQDKRQHGEVLVSTFLGLLSASRHGLSETEALELLSEDKKVMADLKARSARSPEAHGIPAVVWLRLYHDLAPFLMERSADGTALYNFYHRQVDETVKAAYLKPEYHAQLARYFADDKRPLWISDDGNRRPNHRRCAELPYQQTVSEMWDELVETLTGLDFVDAKSKAAMVYDLVADYNRAERSLPEGKEEARKEEERQARTKDYVDRLIAHSSDPSDKPLPEPPPSVQIKRAEAAEEKRGKWSQLERIRAWSHFTANHVQSLGKEIPPIYQLVYNSAANGPVMEVVEQVEKPKYVWFNLCNRKPYNPNPALLKTLEGHTECVTVVSITPDGHVAVSGSDDKTLRVWDLDTGQCIRTLEGHTGKVGAVSITPDGRIAVSGSFDHTVRVWDLHTGHCIGVLEGHTNCVRAVCITPDGRRAVSGSGCYEGKNSRVRVWDIDTGQCIRTLEGRWGNVGAVFISPDGRTAVSASEDMTLRTWDLTNGHCIRTSKKLSSFFRAVSFTTDGHVAVSEGTWDRTLRVWDIDSGNCAKTLEGHTGVAGAVSILEGEFEMIEMERILHTGTAKAVSITPDGRMAVSGSDDMTLRAWDIENGQCVKTLVGHTNFVDAVSVTPDGRVAVSGSDDMTLGVWDIENGQCIRTHEGHNGVSAISITSDGRRAVLGYYGCSGDLLMRDIENGQCIRNLSGLTGTACAVSITPDDCTAVSGSDDGTLWVFEMETGEYKECFEGHTGSITAVSISPDGRLAVSGASDGTLRVWDIEEGECLKTLDGHVDSVGAVSITPDGRMIVCGCAGFNTMSDSWQGTVRMWDIENGQCVKTLVGHTNVVDAVSVTPDGRVAVSGSDDKTLRVWDLDTGQCLKIFEGHVGRVGVVSITPDGRMIVSGSKDGHLHIRNIDTGECIAIIEQVDAVRSIAMHCMSLIVGYNSGFIALLTLANYQITKPVITATRLWLSNQKTWDSNLSALCPWCGTRFIVRDEWIGQEIECPLEGCRKPLKLNPFVCDNSDWLR